jgi:hypothetical protein
MAWSVDARVPLVFGALSDLRPDDALVVEGDEPIPEGVPAVRLSLESLAAHMAGCVCCVPRSAVGQALSGMFLARGRGEVAFYRRVLVITQDAAALRAALEDDLLASSWFRVA